MELDHLVLLYKRIETISNILIKKGNKKKAYFLIYNFLQTIRNSEENFFYFLKKLEKNLILQIDLKIQNKSGVQQKIPKKISYNRSFALPFRWLIQSSKKRKELIFFNKLFFESLDSLDKKSVTNRKRNEWHKIAITNKHLLK